MVFESEQSCAQDMRTSLRGAQLGTIWEESETLKFCVLGKAFGGH